MPLVHPGHSHFSLTQLSLTQKSSASQSERTIHCTLDLVPGQARSGPCGAVAILEHVERNAKAAHRHSKEVGQPVHAANDKVVIAGGLNDKVFGNGVAAPVRDDVLNNEVAKLSALGETKIARDAAGVVEACVGGQIEGGLVEAGCPRLGLDDRAEGGLPDGVDGDAGGALGGESHAQLAAISREEDHAGAIPVLAGGAEQEMRILEGKEGHFVLRIETGVGNGVLFLQDTLAEPRRPAVDIIHLTHGSRGGGGAHKTVLGVGVAHDESILEGEWSIGVGDLVILVLHLVLLENKKLIGMV